MKIDTTRFGTIEVDDSVVLTLKGGLLGFSDATQFILIDHAPGSPFRWLQSCQIPELAFVVVDPFESIPDYPMDPLRAALAEAGVHDEEIAVAVIVTFRKGDPGTTVNLLAPLVFGIESHTGVQTVIHGTDFGTQHKLDVLKVKREDDTIIHVIRIDPHPMNPLGETQ